MNPQDSGTRDNCYACSLGVASDLFQNASVKQRAYSVLSSKLAMCEVDSRVTVLYAFILRLPQTPQLDLN